MIAMATKKLYRSPRGKIFGVCTGLAEWRDLPADPVRLIVFLVVLATGIFPGALIYLAAALLIPMNPGNSYSDETIYTDTTPNQSEAELKAEYERLKRKVEKMEGEMFNKERDWDDRFHQGN
ncbi:phage shock protein C, PspC [Sphaerochaeta globosa str. Buddy]|uniref:Phage shock protein C, PspC n=2 Tax=Sphaerochaeta TaxID=399320 RepID=F0RTP7_SPHGB|nr:phage shock protein C, PspC [Sphaerochaeta globosa str. Buddy]